MHPLARDQQMANTIRAVHQSTGRITSEIQVWSEQAEAEGAIGHARLYTDCRDHLEEAYLHLAHAIRVMADADPEDYLTPPTPAEQRRRSELAARYQQLADDLKAGKPLTTQDQDNGPPNPG